MPVTRISNDPSATQPVLVCEDSPAIRLILFEFMANPVYGSDNSLIKITRSQFYPFSEILITVNPAAIDLEKFPSEKRQHELAILASYQERIESLYKIHKQGEKP